MRSLFRKKGATEILKTLKRFNEPVLEKTFLKEFQRTSYYNAYDRGRGVLLEFELIDYSLDDSRDKLITLTPKGKKFVGLLERIEHLLYDEGGEGADKEE